ncbi:tyrosine-type recombinase/integrase [Flavobacterium kingsejongi]|uniref:Integrase n=1 Tax=Flavobacterium kingsejongi TaxID=1678728 RepID=A0A2S1LLG2_9FLAO|nr:site-specific integrase [Flavobacterium kingsejongi]AWG24406.1 integrase [Flavobacterium kingsejongi]
MVNFLADVRQSYPKNIQTSIRIMAAIKKYYDYLIFIGERNDHPCQTLTVKKGSGQSIQLQDLFSSKELELLLHRENRYRHLENRNKVLISLLIYQGLTSDELTRLDTDNIDLDNGTVYVKGSSKLNRRTLKLDSTQILLFDRYINQTRGEMMKRVARKSNKLLLNKLGQPISVEGIFAVIEVLNPLFPDRKLNPRSIRMSVISNWMNEKKLPLESVQELAGHKWPSTTEKYRKMDNLKQRELINRFFPI